MKREKKGFWTKVFHYEYWPVWFLFLPLVPYWLWLSIRARSLAFFTAGNLNIESGGFYGESKIAILRQFPASLLPPTIFVTEENDFQKIISQVKEAGITFPFIAKPDKGGAGKGVEIIHSFESLENYHGNIGEDYMIQNFITDPIEAGIFYIRMPNEEKGIVTSVVLKEFLSVMGDGKSTVKELIQKDSRARIYSKGLEERLGKQLEEILPKGKNKVLEQIGNHSRGTRFVNGNEFINERMHEAFDKIAKTMNGFYYGRFDVKAKSIEDFYTGENISIIELNGAGSDPGHIFDSSVGWFRALKSEAWHWKQLYKISKINMKRGVKPLSFGEMISLYWKNNFSKEVKKARKPLVNSKI
jgi:D-alanine-D-alanine ligase-like ATP-grasp enzyme